MNKRLCVLAILLIAGILTGPGIKTRAATSAAAEAPVSGPFAQSELKAFTALEPIDSHSHVFVSDPEFVAMLERLHMHVLSICVDDDQSSFTKNLSREIELDLQFVHASQGHGAFCTTFDPYDFAKPGFAQAAIRQINRNFDEGAVAVKIWKNVGMELKDSKGNYILPDNPVFEPIYRDIAAHHKTLIAHLAEPDSCWKPPDPNSPDYSYYKENPEWYMYGKPHAASKEEILKARDHVLEENPHLRVVGAHLGSMESNFNELGEHLDRYPNFAVDLAARMPYLMMQPRATMIAFVTQYQDRLLYGTDLGFHPGEKAQDAIKDWENYYARDWRFLATNDLIEYHGQKVQGLALPAPVLQKIYHDNAVHWIPGILSR